MLKSFIYKNMVINIVWNEDEVLLKEESNHKKLLEYRI